MVTLAVCWQELRVIIQNKYRCITDVILELYVLTANFQDEE